MRWVLGAFEQVLSLLLACAACAAAGESVPIQPQPAKPANIVAVATLADLLAQPQIKLKDAKGREVSVRLGIEAHKAEAGTSLLIYAVANSSSVVENSLDDLGPVVVKVRREGLEELKAMVNKVYRQWPEAPLYFFAKSLPLPTTGRYHVQILKPADEHLLAETAIDVAEEPTGEARWQALYPAQIANQMGGECPWAGSFTIGNRALPKVTGDEAIPLFSATAEGKVEGAEKISLPKLLPIKPIKDEQAAQGQELERQVAALVSKLGSETYAVREAATRELAALGRRAEPALGKAVAEANDPEIRNRAWHLLRVLDGPFTARVADGSIILSMAVSFDPGALYEHLLARWWVNGKPLADREAKELAIDGTGQVLTSRQAALSIDLGNMDIRQTDTVEVEFLYCPMGTEVIVPDVMLAQALMEVAQEQTAAADLFHAMRCLRSNRLKFTASELKRDKP